MYKTDAELAAETRKRQAKLPPNSQPYSIEQVTPKELKALNRDNLSGEDFNRCVATARAVAQAINTRLTPYDHQNDGTLGDPYGDLSGYTVIDAHADAVFLHRLLTFLKEHMR